ncbi:hypothetical protein CRENBAI_024771, partial [Crenichthys baileyi]
MRVLVAPRTERGGDDRTAAAEASAQLTWTGAHQTEVAHVPRRAALRYGRTAALRPGSVRSGA